MKRFRLCFFISAMLALPCTNLFAQFQMDSVVFRFDTTNSYCSSYDNGRFRFDTVKNSSSFSFIVSSFHVFPDSVVYIGKGDPFSDNAQLILNLDTDSHNIQLLDYKQEYSGRINGTV